MTKPNHPVKGAELYRRLLSYVWPYKWLFAVAVLGMVITGLMEPATVAVMKPLIDGGFIEKDPATIAWLPYALVGIFLVRGVGAFLAQYFMAVVGRKIVFDIREKMFAGMLFLPSGFLEQQSSGRLMAKFIFDAERVTGAATQAIQVLVKDALIIVGMLAWLFYLNWKMTLIFLIVVPVLAAIVRVLTRRFRKLSKRIQLTVGDISAVTQEAIEGQRVIKSFVAEDFEMNNFDVVNKRNRKQTIRMAAISSISLPLLQILAAIGMAFVVHYALQQSAEGKITAGEFASYFAAMLWMMNPIKRLMKVNAVIQRGIAAAESIFSLMDQKPEEDNGRKVIKVIEGHVSYSNVSFEYDETGERVLDSVSFDIKPGETLALVGMSGSGKTTIASLLPRFYAVSEGVISIDGIDIREFTLKNLRSHIATVGQDTVLFNDTIRNNITYGCEPEIGEERFRSAAKAAHVTEFVQELPEGFDTIVGEKGVRFSGGQRQRLAIARALYKNAPILILDEATSSLDSESEKYVKEAIQLLKKDRTTLIIAHRLSTIEHADKIVVLQKGKIVEQGAHQELLKKGGVYQSLYQNQFTSSDAATS